MTRRPRSDILWFNCKNISVYLRIQAVLLLPAVCGFCHSRSFFFVSSLCCLLSVPPAEMSHLCLIAFFWFPLLGWCLSEFSVWKSKQTKLCLSTSLTHHRAAYCFLKLWSLAMTLGWMWFLAFLFVPLSQSFIWAITVLSLATGLLKFMFKIIVRWWAVR